MCPDAWGVVVPVKGGADAKSRLRYAGRPTLAIAFALDTVAAARATAGVDEVLVVTADPAVAAAVRALEGGLQAASVELVDDPGAGLDTAVAAGVGRLSARGRRAVAVLLGDHPSLRPEELAVALEACARHTTAFVPDHTGTGTALVTTTVGALVTAFGGGSAARHAGLGMGAVDVQAPGLRLDVDDLADLQEALDLGVGPRTAAALRTTLSTRAGEHPHQR